MENIEHITHSAHQIIRFCHQISKGMTQSLEERKVQFGYNLARLSYILSKNTKDESHITKWINDKKFVFSLVKLCTILTDVKKDEYLSDETLVTLGYYIGIAQEFTEEDHFVWWKPIVPWIQTRNWSELQKFLLAQTNRHNVDSSAEISTNTEKYATVFEKVDWVVLLDMSTEICKQLGIELPSKEFLERL